MVACLPAMRPRITPWLLIEITVGSLLRQASGVRSGMTTPLSLVALACACALSPTRMPAGTPTVTLVTFEPPAIEAIAPQPASSRLEERARALGARRRIAATMVERAHLC